MGSIRRLTGHARDRSPQSERAPRGRSVPRRALETEDHADLRSQAACDAEYRGADFDLRTRILARKYQDGGEWVALAYQGDAVFCDARGCSETTAIENLKTLVQQAIAIQGQAWIEQCAQPEPDVMNCPEGAIKLPIDLWVCKMTKDICPLQAQVFLNDRDLFIRHCQAPEERNEEIFASASNGAYDGFHHVSGRYLCTSCEHEGKKLSFQHHYPWELTHLGAYFRFEYKQDWPAVREKLKDKHFGHTLVSTALCATHCKELAEQIDPVLAAELFVIEFEVDRRGSRSLGE